jgi:ATP-dependent Lhr-like helicase
LSNFENTNGFKVIQQWMADKGISPFKFQVDTWQKFENGYSGMVIAPTGFGKTFSVF